MLLDLFSSQDDVVVAIPPVVLQVPEERVISIQPVSLNVSPKSPRLIFILSESKETEQETRAVVTAVPSTQVTSGPVVGKVGITEKEAQEDPVPTVRHSSNKPKIK